MAQHCSSRRPGLSSKHSHGGSQSCVTPRVAPEDPIFSMGTGHTYGTHMCMQKKHVYILILKKDTMSFDRSLLGIKGYMGKLE